MKKLFASATLLLFSVALFPQSAPIWIGSQYPSITFYDTAKAPLLGGAPTVIDTVELFYSGASGYAILSAEVRGDSLIFTTGLVEDTGIIIDPPIDPVPYSPSADIILPRPAVAGFKVAFDNAGVYQAFENELTIIPFKSAAGPIRPLLYTPRGSFRILPKVQTTPSPLLATDSASVQLLIGQEMMLCYHTYQTRVSVDQDRIFLSYSADTDYICSRMMVTEPVSFGPVFDLGILPAGTYQLIIEDTVAAGIVTVYDIITVNGTVRPMSNPMLDYIPAPIPDVEIIAVPAPGCDMWYIVNAAAPETLRAITDRDGAFSLNIPDDGQDWEITALMRGYYNQSMYLNSYPRNITQPPSVDLSYELIESADSAVAGCQITVLNGAGAPVESASVSLSAGREMLFCPMYAKAAAGTTSLYGYTNSRGQVSFKDASLDPFIDYSVSIYKNMQSAQGLIRLNTFLDLSYSFTLNVVGVEKGKTGTVASTLDVQPNPFNPAVTISFANPGKKADLLIYNVEGKLVQSFRNVAGNRVAWSALGCPSGIYLLKARINGLTQTRKLIYSK